MDNERRRQESVALGAAVALGAGVGTAFFAGSKNSVWIGLGAGLGVLLWTIWYGRRRQD